MGVVNDSDKELNLGLLNSIVRNKSKRNKLCYLSCYEIGMKLIYSAALEEEKLARFLERESRKIRISAYRLKKSPCLKVDTEDLIKANRCITERLRRIACAEKKILQKINKGKELIFCEGACSPIINSLDDTCENINNIVVLALILIILLGNLCCSKEDIFTFVFLLMILVINKIK